MAQEHLSRPRAVPSDFVEMEHSGIEAPLRCSEEAVPHWEARGWKRVSAKSSKKASGGAASGSEN